MRKGIAKIIVALMAAITVFSSFAACGDDIVRDEKTIYVKATLGGYGSSYLTALANQFEKTYEAEGYKVKVLTPSSTLQGTVAIQDMYSDDYADVYFTSGVKLGDVVNGPDYGTLVADITDDVWNKPAIDFSGNEEQSLIKDKLQIEDNAEWSEVNGRRYSLHGNNSIGGLIVNFTKLQKYGITDLPKTTDEMFAAFDAILNGANGMKASSVTNIYPLTFLGGQNGYHNHLVFTWFAQYSGAEAYEEAWSWDDLKNVTDADVAAAKIVSGDGINEMLKAVYKTYDSAYVAKGSSSNTISMAHSKIMNDKEGAVFMTDGDWAYNEIFTDYAATISDLRFINVPVISALGVKLFGEEKGEEYLRYIIDKTDEGKSCEEIVSALKTDKNADVASEKVLEVMKARGVYCSRSKGAGNVFISNKTANADICYKFLRMYASEDAAGLILKESNAYTAYTTSYDSARTEYHKGYAAILNQTYSYGVWKNAIGFKGELGKSELLPLSGDLMVDSVIKQNVTKFEKGKLKPGATDKIYADAAAARIADDLNYVKTSWSKWLGSIGK